MRFVVLRKSEKWMEEPGPPDPELVAAMQRYDDEMRKAGVLVAVERLQPSATATRLHISGGKSRTVEGRGHRVDETLSHVPGRQPGSAIRDSSCARSAARGPHKLSIQSVTEVE
jgi:hypothetical protein